MKPKMKEKKMLKVKRGKHSFINSKEKFCKQRKAERMKFKKKGKGQRATEMTERRKKVTERQRQKETDRQNGREKDRET